MPITIEDAPNTLPSKAKRIYVAAWNSAYSGTCKDRSDKDECASKIAWSVVKQKYERTGDTWSLKADLDDQYVSFSMHIDKAVYNKESQEFRWHCVASDVDEDSYQDNMTLELFNKFLSRIESGERPPEKYCSDFWSGGLPYLSLSHYSDQNGKAVPGPVESVYLDGEKFKGKGTFYKTSLGLACFDAINKDKFAIEKTDHNPVRISIAFLDYAHRHKSNGEIFKRESANDLCPWCVVEALTGTGEGKEYLDGHLIHFALTRVPVNKRTSMEVTKSMATRKDDAKSIVGENLAEEVDENETVLRADLVIKSEEVVEKQEVEEEDDEDEEKKKKDDEEMEEKSAHILDTIFNKYRSAFDSLLNADASADKKLEAMQPFLSELGEITRAELEGKSVKELRESQEIAELKSEISQLRQDLKILSQSLTDKSNTQEVVVPERRSIAPVQSIKPELPPAQEATGFKAQIRKSVGL